MLERGCRDLRIDDQEHEPTARRHARCRSELVVAMLEDEQLAALGYELELAIIDPRNAISCVRAMDQPRDRR